MNPIRFTSALLLLVAARTDGAMPSHPGEYETFEVLGVLSWLEVPCEQTLQVGDKLHIHGTCFTTSGLYGPCPLLEAALVPLDELGQPINNWFSVNGGGHWTGWTTDRHPTGGAGTHRVATLTMDSPGTWL